jgi:acetyl esterase/lipase
MLRYIFPALSVVLLLASVFTVFPPFTNFLWKLTVLVTEWGHYLALAALFLGILSYKRKIILFVSCLSFLLLLLPLIRAYSISAGVKQDIELQFGQGLPEKGRREPLALKELFLGVRYEERPVTSLVFNPAKRLALDFYPSASGKLSPCVVVIHGGAWAAGNSRQLPELNHYLSAKGYAVAAVNYRLAPVHRYPDQIGDIREAVSFIKAEAGRLGVDSSNIVLLGRSAGGQLALQAAYTFNDPNIAGVISFYAPADMIWGYSLPGNPLILDSRKVLCDFIGYSCDSMPGKYAEASPIEQVRPGLPPTLLLHGRPDVMVAFGHSQRLVKKLKNSGIKHYLVDLPWATHGYDFNFSGPGSQISIYAIEAFLGYITRK